MEYYLATKNNKVLPFATLWMDLEIIILSEISQSDKEKYHMISLYVESLEQTDLTRKMGDSQMGEFREWRD